MTTLRVGFIQDFSTDNESERNTSLRELRRWTGHTFEVVHASDERGFVDPPEMDLLIVDYGGLHSAWDDALQRYGDTVNRWAEEHPGRLVLLWTAFTAACYKAIFEDFAADNVLMRYQDAWDFAGTPGFQDAIRAWLGDVRQTV